MIDLRTTPLPPRLDLPDAGAFALGVGPHVEEDERMEALETGGGQGWGLEPDPQTGPDVWRLCRTPPRVASGWVFIANEGGPIVVGDDETQVDLWAWSLSSALGRGHLVAFEHTIDEGGTGRRAAVVGLVAVVIMGAVPQTAMAAEPTGSWDELTQAVDASDPSVPRYGTNATMATAPVVVGAPSAAGTTGPRDGGPAAPGTPAATGEPYPADYGKGRVVGGAVLTGVGGAAFIAGVGMAAYFKSSVKYWLPVMAPGAVMLGVGIPLLVNGLQRKKLRGQPRMAVSNLRILPLKTRRFSGAGLTFRF